MKLASSREMPVKMDSSVTELLKPMLKKRFYVAFSRATAKPEDLLPFVAEHLAYMTILKADTIEEARALMQTEPLIERGLRTFDLKVWELREGQITITLNSSVSGFRLN
jgi:hypothetical protein